MSRHDRVNPLSALLRMISMSAIRFIRDGARSYRAETMAARKFRTLRLPALTRSGLSHFVEYMPCFVKASSFTLRGMTMIRERRSTRLAPLALQGALCGGLARKMMRLTTMTEMLLSGLESDCGSKRSFAVERPRC